MKKNAKNIDQIFLLSNECRIVELLDFEVKNALI